MDKNRPIFFCAIGGSGMMPLALILRARGYTIFGSDRGRDQGRTPERFAFLESEGIRLFPQDGSGIGADVQLVVTSAAVEDTVPDVRAATEKGIRVQRRAALLAALFNGAKTRIAVAGTSGKSTTTGMIGWILERAGRAPTVMNGAVMKNFVSADVPFASALVGDPELFVSEVDESDGSIDLFNPTLCVLNNIAHDHKSMDELRGLFSRAVSRAERAVINLDNAESASLSTPSAVTFSLHNKNATLFADSIEFSQGGSSFRVTYAPEKKTQDFRLPLPGRYNIANALAATGAALSLGISLALVAESLAEFAGVARRMERVGTAKGVVVYDDFAHNPDKIAASLEALQQFDGRLAVLFQPHGFGPLTLMKEGFVAVFSRLLRPEDALFIVDPLYLGGTTTRAVTSADLVAALREKGCPATYEPDREVAAAAMAAAAQSGDRLIIMGARDDTLPALAARVLTSIG